MGGLAANHAAEGDDARVAAGLGEGHRAERQLERPGTVIDGHGVAADADLVELGERRLEQQFVTSPLKRARDDADAAAGRPRLALEEVDVVRNVQLAGRVLARESQRGLGVVELGRLVVVPELVGLVLFVLVELVVLLGLDLLVEVDLCVVDRAARHILVAADGLAVVVGLLAGPGFRCAHSSSDSNFNP